MPYTCDDGPVHVRTFDVEGRFVRVVDNFLIQAEREALTDFAWNSASLQFSKRAAEGVSPLLFSSYQKDLHPRVDELYRGFRTYVEYGEPLSRQQDVRNLVFEKMQVNYTPPGEYRIIHVDSTKPHDLTCLYFANEKWDVEWGGELLLYNRAKTEVLHAVTPKPGRMVIFESCIPHRGGTQSVICREIRMAVVLRFKRP
jgi:hypothetical protein